MDTSKAYDRIEYVKLFKVLLDKSWRPVMCRLIYSLYLNKKIRISWGNSLAKCFKVTNGVKQVAVLSPILFSVYINVLITRLRASNIGCYIGKSIRRLFNIPYRTHCALLPLICQDIPVETQLHSRLMKFVLNNSNCEKACVQLCMSICINGIQSVVENSLNLLAFKNIFCKNSLISNKFNKLYKNIKYVYVTNEKDCVTAGNIIDLLYMRDHCSMSKPTKSDVQLMIGFLCLN